MDKIVSSSIEVRRHPGGCGAEILGIDLRIFPKTIWRCCAPPMPRTACCSSATRR
jgi:hypothetical protein